MTYASFLLFPRICSEGYYKVVGGVCLSVRLFVCLSRAST